MYALRYSSHQANKLRHYFEKMKDKLFAQENEQVKKYDLLLEQKEYDEYGNFSSQIKS